MSKIPCKKCPSCGFYHDLSVMVCDECGADLKEIPALITETDSIPGEKYGNISDEVTVFVQKCSNCGALNFTADKGSRVLICHNCHKKRVAAIEPTEYSETPVSISSGQGAANASDAADDDKKKPGTPFAGNAGSGNSSAYSDDNSEEEDDDDDDEDTSQWKGILFNIKSSVGSKEHASAQTPESTPSQKPAEKPASPAANSHNSDDDDDDDDDAVTDWSEALGGKGAKPSGKTEPVQKKGKITFTAVRYGRYSFSIDAKPGERYMLGRDANHKDFLKQDTRIGNEHCYISFKNESWYVRDNNSRNGTFVNSRYIGEGGETALNDGDLLKLGHNDDSIEFRVTIE